MQQQEMQQLIDHYIAAYNRFDVAGMLATLDAQVVFENYANGECNLALRGLPAFEKLAEKAKSMLSARQQTITTAQFGDNNATLNIQYCATLATDLPSGGKAGETLQLDGKSVFRFDQGKISYLADYN